MKRITTMAALISANSGGTAMQQLKGFFRTRTVLVLALVMLAIPASRALGDSTTSPGKNAVFVAHQAYDPCCGVQLSGTISKGREHHVLLVQVTFDTVAITLGCPPTSIDIEPPEVNDVLLKPDDAGYVSARASCDAFGLCPTITGTYWLDLDEAEAAHPETFIGKPLNVTSGGRWYGTVCSATASVSMAARLIKK